jgi:hypothetical protein
MPVYYPKVAVRLVVTYQLSRTREDVQEVTFFAHPRSVKIERNEFSKADECTLEFDSMRFPMLPRMIRQVLCQVYLGDAGALDEELGDGDLAIIGYWEDPELALSEGDGSVKVKLLDFTALYLQAKRPSQVIVPTYGDNLRDALRRILDAVPGGENIRLKLVQDGERAREWPFLDEAAPPGLQKAKIAYDPNDTLWKLIERCCDPFGLIPRIELDTLIVSTSRGVTPAPTRPLFVYGANLIDYREKRLTQRVREGIALSGYDLSTQSYIFALWPPAGDQSVKKKIKTTRVATTKKGSKSKVVKLPTTIGANATPVSKDEKRHWWPYGVVANEETLLDAARSLYENRSRQEFEGSFTTSRFFVAEDVGDGRFDVRKITSGDAVVVDVDPKQRQVLGGITSPDGRIAYLVAQGYPRELAIALGRAYESGVEEPLAVFVRSATLSLSESEGFGSP